MNDGCAALGTGENIVACTDAVDVTPGNDPINGVKDNDSYINDGCPAHQTGDGVCGDAVDSDTDGAVNDGCGISGVVSEADQCANTTDDDLPLADDALVNDGCPGWGLPESGGECTDAADGDGDTMVNDGCPLAGAAEAAVDCGDFGDDDGDKIADDGCSETVFPSADCTDNLDNDHDGVINDGCYYDGVLSLDESGGQCDDISDNDSDGLVNDGCAATEPAAILSANATGVLENPTALLTVGSIGPGTVDAIVITMEALVVVCGVSPLDLTNAEMLDNLYDPLSPVTVTERSGWHQHDRRGLRRVQQPGTDSARGTGEHRHHEGQLHLRQQRIAGQRRRQLLRQLAAIRPRDAGRPDEPSFRRSGQ